MILCIDSGNTMEKFSLMDAGHIKHLFRTANNPLRTLDEYFAWLSSHFQQVNVSWEDIHFCVISSVVPKTLMNLEAFASTHFGPKRFAILTPDHPDLPIKVRVDNPLEVGSDLLGTTLGAHTLYPSQGGIILDCGTATTVTCIDEAGSFLGALIAPGFQTSLEALFGSAAKIPPLAFSRPQHMLGKNTLDAVNAGMYFGYSGLAEKMVFAAQTYLTQVCGLQKIVKIATGGYIPHLDLSFMDVQDSNLLFKGLWFFYENLTKYG